MYKILKFDLGRNALRYLVKIYGIKKIKIPYYLCDAVRHTLVEEGCKPIFYHIDDNFYPAEDFDKDEYVIYPNYWGVYGNNVKKLAEKYPKLIVDNAHAFYDEPNGFACFNAGHKFGYKDSYLWIKSESSNQNSVLLVDENAKIRQEKFLELHKKYSANNLLKIDTNSVPFVYPFLAETIEEADELVKILNGKGKTVYRFWNPLPKSFCEYKFYSRLVPIPVLPLS